MTRTGFIESMGEMMELPKGALQPYDVLAKYAQWDSLAIVGFIALADRHLGVAVDPGGVAKANTVEDLLKLLGDKLK